MKIMLDCSPAKIREYRLRYDHDFWQLRTPLTNYRLEGCNYGLDNGAFSSFDLRAWRRLVDDAEANMYDANPQVICKFVTLPDIVGDARRTLDLFDHFLPETSGLPRALVLQDDISNFQIPWKDIACVFVGGSDSFKTSHEAINAAKTAKILGKWVHVGRVNTAARVRNWIGLADSCDGSGMSRFDHMLEDVLAMIRGESPQHSLVM